MKLEKKVINKNTLIITMLIRIGEKKFWVILYTTPTLSAITLTATSARRAGHNRVVVEG